MYQAPPPIDPFNQSGSPNSRTPEPSWRHLGCLVALLAPLLLAIVLIIALS